MLVVIFGAGASHDSVDTAVTTAHQPAWQPPLANALFADRDVFRRALAEFNQCLEIVVHLRSRIATGSIQVERELEELAAQEAVYPRRRNELMATRFYLQKIMYECGDQYLGGAGFATNYLLLADRLHFWSQQTGTPLHYITFNYDTMFEAALIRHGLTIDRGGGLRGYVASTEVQLVKVHGSVNWGHPVELGDRPSDARSIRQALIERAPNVPGDKFELMDNPEDIRRQDDVVLSPAIALPLATKSGFVCPREHQEAAAFALRDASKILIVGWRGADQHFLEFWRDVGSVDALVHVVSPDSADEVVLAITTVGIPRDQITTSNDTFSRFLRTADLKAFLDR